MKVVLPLEAFEHFKAQKVAIDSLLRPFQFRVEFGFDVGALTDSNLEALPQYIYLDTVDSNFYLDASKWQDLCQLAQPHRLSLTWPTGTVLSTDPKQGSTSGPPNSSGGAEEGEAESGEAQEEEKQEKNQDGGEDDIDNEDKEEEGDRKQGKGEKTESSKVTRGSLYFFGSIPLEDEEHKPYALIHHIVDLQHTLKKQHRSNSCYFDFRSLTFQYQTLQQQS